MARARHDGPVPVGAQYIGSAVGPSHDAARFANEQCACRDVPRRELQLPEAVEPSSRDVREIERGAPARRMPLAPRSLRRIALGRCEARSAL